MSKHNIESVRLDFSEIGLHGREKEIQLLQECFERVEETRDSEVVLLQGKSGAGKSALAATLEERVTVEGGGGGGAYFVTGKYDEMGSSQPYSAIVEAFSELCKTLSHEKQLLIAEHLREELGPDDLAILTRVLPKIDLIFGSSIVEDTSVKMEWGFERLKVAFQAIIHALAAKSPLTLVLFIDDLQWADVSSLELINAIVTDAGTEALLFIGAYRNTVVDNSHPLSIHLRDIAKRKIPVTTIAVTNLGVTDTNSLITELLQSRPTETLPLAELVHKKTDGNAFFVLQFLKTLQEREMLYMSGKAYKWEWNLDRIQGETDLADNVVELVATNIQGLPEDVSKVLIIGACLGSHFHLDIVGAMLDSGDDAVLGRAADKSVQERLTSAIEIASKEGLVTNCRDPQTYKFAHDRIQQSAYSLVSSEARLKLHFKIGHHLKALYQEDCSSTEWMMLVFVDQLNHGLNVIEGENERLELAKYNLAAARKVFSQSAFVAAEKYLRAGLKLLEGKQGWKSHYLLQLGLCELLAEVTYCIGNFEASEYYVNQVLGNAVCLEHKYRVFVVKVEALGSEERLEAAVEAGFGILAELGEKVPRRPNRLHVASSMLQASIAARGMSDEAFLSLPLLKDKRKLLAMRIMATLVTFAWFAYRPDETAILSLQMFRISLKYGLSKYSAYAFATFGYMLGFLFKFDEAFRYGQLALRLIEEFRAKECDCMAMVVIHSFTIHLQRPLQEQMDPILRAYQYGMETGDIQHSSLAGTVYTMMYFYSGLPLGPLLDDSRAFANQMNKYNQATHFSPILVYQQMVLNLMGRSENPVVLTGDAMNQDQYMSDAETNNIMGKVQSVWFALSHLGYLFGDFGVAALNAQRLWNRPRVIDSTNFYMPSYFMFLTLIAMEMAKRTGKRKFKRNARKHYKLLALWVKLKALNSNDHLLLVIAQRATTRERHPAKVKACFEVAIRSAQRSGFVPTAALANELAGKYFIPIDRLESMAYLSRAQNLYREWGAQAKVEQLERNFTDLLVEASDDLGGSAFRGRRRFSKAHMDRHQNFNPIRDRPSLSKSLS